MICFLFLFWTRSLLLQICFCEILYSASVLLSACACTQHRTSKMTSDRNIKKRSNPVDVDTDKEFEVGEMHVSKSVKIHGVMTSLSPMKPSASGMSKYFHGQLTDGKNKVRFVGFDAKVHEKLSDFHLIKEGIALSNCEVKEGKYSAELEVVVRRSTELHKSPKKFDVAASMFVVNNNLVMLEEIPRLSNYRRVSVRVKVMAEEEAIEVKKGW